jgi:hypothetical protein
MPRNPASEIRTRHIVSILESRFGPLYCNHPHRFDWYSSRYGKVDVFITDSKFHEHHRWFDMAYADIKELAAHQSGFIIFVLGSKDNFLVIPAKDLIAELPNYQPGHTTNDGRYHFNLPLGGNTFSQLPNWKLNQYAENIDLIPKISN